MNKTQQKQAVKALAMIEEGFDIISELLGDIQGNYDNKSEKWQEGEAGEKAQEDISNLEDAVNDLESAKSHLENVIELD